MAQGGLADEYDGAIAALRAQLEASNLRAATAWSEQQRVETELVARP